MRGRLNPTSPRRSGLAPSAVLERIRKLEAKGVIREYVAVDRPACRQPGAARVRGGADQRVRTGAAVGAGAGADSGSARNPSRRRRGLLPAEGPRQGRRAPRSDAAPPDCSGAGCDLDAHDHRAGDRQGDIAHSDRETANHEPARRHSRASASSPTSRGSPSASCGARPISAFAWRSNRCPWRCSPGCAGRVGRRCCSPRRCRSSARRLPPPRTWGSIAIAGFLMAVIGNGGVVWAAAVRRQRPGRRRRGDGAVLDRARRSAACRAVSGSRAARFVGLAVGFLGIVVLVWPELTHRRRRRSDVRPGRSVAADRLPGLGARHVVHEAQRRCTHRRSAPRRCR